MLGLLFIILVLLGAVAAAQEAVVSGVQPHGNRRIPAETIKSRIFTKPGDVYDPAALERDFNSLWNTGYFEDLRFEREDTPKGVVIHVYVKEKPTIREIKYVGLNAVSQSDVLDRFKERKVNLTQESQYDPTRVKRAEVVLKEMLSEHGRQFATIRSEIRPIPPAAVAVTFIVKEGAKVKVGKIRFEGNKKLKSGYLRRAMKNTRPIGIPHSIILESLFSKTYNAAKLSEDAERVRDAYQQKGYFKALVGDPKTQMRDAGGFHFPLIQKGGGKRVDLTIPIEEGDRYRLAAINFTGNKAVTSTAFLRALFPMKDGAIFSTADVRKGLDNLRKAYGEIGYINFTPVPDSKIDEEKKLITLNVDLDEGKQFFVRRIEFMGNTTTRDKVIRRELAIEEGQVYNSRLWELSLLRLNQLGYFEPLKTEQQGGDPSYEIKRNEQESWIDLNLKVKEKGKNSIGLTGGVSGLAGSFIGINYETNNFLGLGETLRVQANFGNRTRNILFGFTEPYLFDRPLQLGFTVFTSRYNFNQAREASIAQGTALNLSQSFLETLQNFTQNSTGFTVSGSYALRRSFNRVGLTYGFDRSSVTVFSTASRQLFETLAFRGVSGPNSLEGVITSKLVPSFSFSTINDPMRPTRGHSFFVGGDIAGVGGNVRMLRPVVEYKKFMPFRRTRHVIGFHVQGSFLTGYAGRVAPPFERFYLGGDNDIRGFDIRSVTPYAFIVNKVNVTLSNPDGTPVPIDPSNPRRGNVTVPIPINQIVFTGGDTSFIANAEYRIPIAGPVTIAPFIDFGTNAVTRTSQLRLSEVQINDLNSTNFGCQTLTATSGCVGNTRITVPGQLDPISGTNFRPRVSTGVELQVIMPIVNAPFRIYWAYNPLRLNTSTTTPATFTRDMFPPGGAGDFSFQQALSQFAPSFVLREPAKTFRFTVSTTF